MTVEGTGTPDPNVNIREAIDTVMAFVEDVEDHGDFEPADRGDDMAETMVGRKELAAMRALVGLARMA